MRALVGDSLTRRATGAEPSSDSFAPLCAVFAVALLLDQLWWGGFELGSPHTVVVLAAAWALLRPRSVCRFGIMTAAVVVSVTADLPSVGTHRLLELVVAGCVLVQLVWTAVRYRHVPEPEEVYEPLAAFFRVALLVVYAFAALSKMNTDFLDPTVSCAGPMSQQIVWFNPGILSGQWLVSPAILATVAIETSLPVLLALRWTRPLGVVLGLGFHTVLAFAGNVPFTAVALAFYVTFLPPGALSRARHLLTAPHSPLAAIGRVLRRPAVTLFVLVVLVAAWVTGARFGPSESTPGLQGTASASLSPLLGTVTRLLVVALILVEAVLLVLGLWSEPARSRYPPGQLRVRSPVLLVGVLVLLVNGACPYLGPQDRHLLRDVLEPAYRARLLEQSRRSRTTPSVRLSGPAFHRHGLDRRDARGPHRWRQPDRGLRARTRAAGQVRHDGHLSGR